MFPPLSVDTARANIVFPHPGGPYSNAPLGGLIPIFRNFSGSLIAAIRFSSKIFFASSNPPTFSQKILDRST